MNDIAAMGIGDPATLPFHLPPEVATAIVAVAAQVRQLGKDEKNPHGGYAYLSVDKIYDFIGPLMAEAGLFLMIDEVSSEVREGARSNPWLFTRYAMRFGHAKGACSPIVYRSLALPINGPQTYGTAQSYIEKQFLRQVFKIPTGEKDAVGEKDADEVKQDDTAPVSRGRTEPFKVPEPRMPRPPLKPIQPPPQAVFYDPETGEVGPHPIPVPMTPEGKPDWVAFGGNLVTHLQRTDSLAEGEEWIAQNAAPLGECSQQFPKVYTRIEANIRQMRDRLGGPDFMDPDDPLRPL